MKNVLVAMFCVAAYGQLTISTSALPNPIIQGNGVGLTLAGSVWSLLATGGATPYVWSISSGSLPAGLSLGSSTGAITGTPTATGPSAFTVKVTDSAGLTATQSFTISTQYAIGHGCTTATVIDWDCDYYGTGSAIGPDADDNDATVNTPATMIAKYGTLTNFLSTVKGYSPNNIWYLSTSGNDSTCVHNNASLPCLTWNSTVAKMSVGDALIVRAGTWTANSNYSAPTGTSSHRNYYMAYPGELAILDHTVSGWYGLQGATQYVTIDGLEIQNTPCAANPGCAGGSGYGLVFTTANAVTHLTIRNCNIHDYDRNIWGIADSDNVLIEKNVLHDDTGEHALYLGNNNTDSGGVGGQTSTVVVQYNLLYNSYRDNFHFNGICTGCLLDSNIMYSANNASGGGAANVSLQQGWNHSTVSNNIVFSASAYAFLINTYYDGQPNINAFDSNYNLIVNNTFIHTGWDSSGQNLSGSGFGPVALINTDTGSSGTVPVAHDLGHNTYANNILVEIAGPSNNITGNAVRYQRLAPDVDWLTTDTWTNNIVYISNSASPLGDGLRSGYAVPQFNWAYFAGNAGTVSPAVPFANMTQTNPLLVATNYAWWPDADSGMWNLRAAAGSPASGSGTALSAPSKDIQGVTRSTFDIGAYAASGRTGTPLNYCDINSDGVVNVIDVTIAVAQTIGSQQCTSADLATAGVCSIVDVQRVITAALGGACIYR